MNKLTPKIYHTTNRPPYNRALINRGKSAFGLILKLNGMRT